MKADLEQCNNISCHCNNEIFSDHCNNTSPEIDLAITLRRGLGVLEDQLLAFVEVLSSSDGIHRKVASFSPTDPRHLD
ncbi:hypothetical protein J6590_024594 [Homalodisca vitripennis]|nr:hypothetical protein J6590_024594 [Homalodisca vitripennis]